MALHSRLEQVLTRALKSCCWAWRFESTFKRDEWVLCVLHPDTRAEVAQILLAERTLHAPLLHPDFKALYQTGIETLCRNMRRELRRAEWEKRRKVSLPMPEDLRGDDG